MEIAGSTEELLWNVSYLAVTATSLTRQHVLERHSNRRVEPATEFEETTTSNLLRHLGYYGQNLGVLAVQHTKALEGGRTSKGRQVIVPSGADLELAIEVRPGGWLNMLLQAKTLKASGTYASWAPQQNRKLIDWANASGRIPGMMLYNDLLPPFVATAPPRTAMDFACSAFGACTSVARTQRGIWGSSVYCVGPDRTPAGIGLCLDQALMLAKPPPSAPADIEDHHFPVEHLLHTWEHHKAVDAAGTTLDSLVTTVPAWASQLLEARVAGDLDLDDMTHEDQPLEVAARLSAVIPLIGVDA